MFDELRFSTRAEVDERLSGLLRWRKSNRVLQSSTTLRGICFDWTFLPFG
jgi:hypothetical protein